MPIAEIDYMDLDPGVRRLVRIIRNAGFNTTDSGDGVSKGEDGEPYPHVHIVLPDYADMVLASKQLLNLMRAWFKEEPEGFLIQATYSPIDNTKTLHVFHVTDDHLKE